MALALAVWFRAPLAEARALLWPPTEPLSQWSFLVLLHVGGLVVVPVVAGSALADWLYDRRR